MEANPMVQTPVSIKSNEIHYPDSDGQPMADNTLQFDWIVQIKENCERLFVDREDVFIAGDLLWYPVEGNNKLCLAPDIMIVFGRPKGYRGSYQQWKEDHIPPQVVFEILSPGNRLKAMTKKFEFYETYGVEEYYLYDPDEDDLQGWISGDGAFQTIENLDQWISPRLGVRFSFTEGSLTLYGPDGKRFLSFTELSQQADRAESRAEEAETKAQQAEIKAQQAEIKAQQEAAKVAQLMAQLRSLGIDPDVP
jgi:Uma2 family endonuclease